jgi:hypothetical protein
VEGWTRRREEVEGTRRREEVEGWRRRREEVEGTAAWAAQVLVPLVCQKCTSEVQRHYPTRRFHINAR